MSERNLPVPNIYYDQAFSKNAAKIMPGEYFVTNKDMLIVSVVGASVVVCIRDADSGIGGMTHFMAPSQHHELNGSLLDAAQAVATNAIESLIKQLVDAGCVKSAMEAKVFSGPCAFDEKLSPDVTFIERSLKSKIATSRMHALAETPASKVYFFPKSGKVLVKKISELNNSTVTTRQQHYIQSVIAQSYKRPPK